MQQNHVWFVIWPLTYHAHLFANTYYLTASQHVIYCKLNLLQNNHFLKLFVEKNKNVSRHEGKISSRKLSECLQILTLKSSCLPDLKLIRVRKLTIIRLFLHSYLEKITLTRISKEISKVDSYNPYGLWKFTYGLFFSLNLMYSSKNVVIYKIATTYVLFFFPLPLNGKCPELQFRIFSKFYKSFCKIQAKMDVNPRTNFPQHKSWSPSKMRRPYDDDKLPLISRSVEGTLLCAGILRGHRLPHFNDPKSPEWPKNDGKNTFWHTDYILLVSPINLFAASSSMMRFSQSNPLKNAY